MQVQYNYFMRKSDYLSNLKKDNLSVFIEIYIALKLLKTFTTRNVFNL